MGLQIYPLSLSLPQHPQELSSNSLIPPEATTPPGHDYMVVLQKTLSWEPQTTTTLWCSLLYRYTVQGYQCRVVLQIQSAVLEQNYDRNAFYFYWQIQSGLKWLDSASYYWHETTAWNWNWSCSVKLAEVVQFGSMLLILSREISNISWDLLMTLTA